MLCIRELTEKIKEGIDSYRQYAFVCIYRGRIFLKNRIKQ